MKERKNIDRLYQENFRDFAPEPRPELWDKIAGNLQEKDRKKPFVIPLWLKLSGAAAVLALMLGGYFLSTSDFTHTQVVFEVEESAKPPLDYPEINQNHPFTSASRLLENIIHSTDPESGGDSYSAGHNSSLTSSNTPVETQKTPTDSSKEQIASNQSAKKTGPQNSALAGENKKGSPEAIKNPEIIGPKDKQHTEAIAQNKRNDAEKKEQLSLKDSLEVAEELAQIEAEKNLEEEEQLIAEASGKKLRLSTFAAPVFFDNLGSGNTIDPQFANNNTTSQVSMAYGMNLAYAISDKIKIRSGISKVAMNYQVEDIIFTPSINPSSISSINYANNRNFQLANAPTDGPPQSDREGTVEFSGVANSNLPGEINQQFGFIEVPVEIEYSLLDSRIGLNLIAGGSSLFLDDNSIQVNTNNQNTQIGQANNINKISFSTNIGLGVDYKLTESFMLNLEPILKYQLNTFSNAPDVRPYYFGIYSGVSFRF